MDRTGSGKSIGSSSIGPAFRAPDLPGWRQDTTGARRFSDLPPRAQEFVRQVEEIAQCDVGLVSVGPDREQSILREGSRLAGRFPNLSLGLG